MNADIDVIVRCGNQPHRLYDTVRSLDRQQRPAERVVVVTDPTTPSMALAWVQSFGSRRLGVVEATASTAGGAWNHGVRAAQARWIMCVDAGDRLDPRALRLLEAGLLVASRTAVASTGESRRASRGASDIQAKPCDAATLASDPNLLTGAIVFRASRGSAQAASTRTCPPSRSWISCSGPRTGPPPSSSTCRYSTEWTWKAHFIGRDGSRTPGRRPSPTSFAISAKDSRTPQT